MLLFNSKVIIIKLNKESTWISYSIISTYYSIIPTRTRDCGSTILTCDGSMVFEFAFSDVVWVALSSFADNTRFWFLGPVSGHYNAFNSLGTLVGQTPISQRPALDYKIRHLSKR